MRRIAVLVLGVAALLGGEGARASTIIALDFQQSGDTVQAGFTQFAGPVSQTTAYALTFGNLTVTVTAQTDGNDLGGGFFDRSSSGGSGGFSPLTNSGAFTYANLYNSFAYNNSSQTNLQNTTAFPTSISLNFSGAGISALTPYSLMFYSFDTDGGRPATSGTHTETFTGTAGTIGSAGNIVWSDQARPTSNNQYSSVGTFTSDASGNLNIVVSDSYVNNFDSRSGVRLNALILSTASAPEPGTLGMLALALGGMACLRKTRRQR
jgi:hypothetical protein